MNVNAVVTNVKSLIPVSYISHGNAPISKLTNNNIYEIKLFFTKFITFLQKNGPINSSNIAQFYNELSYSKTNQHLLGYIFSDLRVSILELTRIFPDIQFHTSAQFINTTEAISIIAFQALKVEFEQTQNLLLTVKLLPNACGSYLKPMNEIINSFQNTGQLHPDGLVNFHNKEGVFLGRRYLDAKLGNSSGFHGNIMIAYNSEELIAKATKLLSKQYIVLGQCKPLFDAHPYLREAFEILGDRSIDVLQRLALTQTIFKSNIYTLPNTLVSSFLLYCETPKEKVLDFSIEDDAIKTNENTTNLFVKFLKENVSQGFSKRILASEGLKPSLKERIWSETPFLKKVSTLPEDLSSFL